MEQESDGDTNCDFHSQYSHQNTDTRNGELGSKYRPSKLQNLSDRPEY